MLAAIIIIISLLFIAKHLLKYIQCINNLKDYPPGPTPLPVIGNLHMIGSHPAVAFANLSKKYGDVFGFSFGNTRIVVVNSVALAREALITKSSVFAGRPNGMYMARMLFKDFKGIVMEDYGPMWRMMRKVSHSALKMYGDGMGRIEEKVVKESQEMHVRLRRKLVEGPIDLQHELGLSVMNVICSMVFNHRYETNNPEFEKFFLMNKFVIEASSPTNLVTYFPWLRHVPYFNQRHNKLKEAIDIRDELIGHKLMDHLNSYDANNVRDFTDALIRCSRDPNILVDSGADEISKVHLESVLFDVFFAGAETTHTTLRWCVLYLLHYPQYQDILYDEIINMIGQHKYPTLKDRSQLPLFRAFLHEVLRMSSIVELNLPHKAVQDDTIGGFKVPKGTDVVINLWRIHHDEGVWDQPNDFIPYRWLDKEGRFVPGKHKSFLPFSAGRRSCLGESLAKTELFLFLTRLVRDFRIEADMGRPFPSMERIHGIVCTPVFFTVTLLARTNGLMGT